MFVSTSLSCHLVYADSLTHAVHGNKYKTKMGKAGPKIQYGTVINLGPGVLPPTPIYYSISMAEARRHRSATFLMKEQSASLHLIQH